MRYISLILLKPGSSLVIKEAFSTIAEAAIIASAIPILKFFFISIVFSFTTSVKDIVNNFSSNPLIILFSSSLSLGKDSNSISVTTE